jgi:hypothetical protein
MMMRVPLMRMLWILSWKKQSKIRLIMMKTETMRMDLRKMIRTHNSNTNRIIKYKVRIKINRDLMLKMRLKLSSLNCMEKKDLIQFIKS